MRKSRFSEAQIIGMIKEQEAGMPTADVCRNPNFRSLGTHQMPVQNARKIGFTSLRCWTNFVAIFPPVLAGKEGGHKAWTGP